MAILRHMDIIPAEARAYLKHASAMRRAIGEDDSVETSAPSDEDDTGEDLALGVDRIAALDAAEQFVLTISDNGYGKRTSAYEYRVSGRGGKGLFAHDLRLAKMEGAHLAASFPVNDGDGIMLVTDGGQLIRVPIGGIRIAGRATAGVTIIRLKNEERVVAVQRIVETDEDEDGDEKDAADDAAGTEKP